MVYTSRYSNKGLSNEKYVLLGISLGRPKFHTNYKLDGEIQELKPYKSFRVNDYEKAKAIYFKQLDKYGAMKIRQAIASHQQEGKDIVLLCFEDITKPGSWCHRKQFAEWWEEKSGQLLEELPDADTWEMQHLKKCDEQEMQKRQISLFDMQA